MPERCRVAWYCNTSKHLRLDSSKRQPKPLHARPKTFERGVIAADATCEFDAHVAIPARDLYGLTIGTHGTQARYTASEIVLIQMTLDESTG